MKKLRFVSLMVAALFMGFGFTSCEKDSILTDDDDAPKAWELTVDEGGTGNVTVYVTDLEDGATSVDVAVKFTSTDGKMRRLYMTKNTAGGGAEKFELDIKGLSKKGDGSLDLSGNEKKEFKFNIPFPVLPDLKEGTVVYQLWATSGIGDYRNMDKRLVVGPGTITVDYGGVNPANALVKEFTAKMLAAPLASGKSKTFISLIDGQLYEIIDGEEFAAFWDFGYYYGASGVTKNDAASLASTSNYEDAFQVKEGVGIVDVDGIAGTTELNNCYFAQSEMDFDAVQNASDLNGIIAPENQTITNLSVGDVIEFVDNYGKKGVIKVTEIKGTYNENDYIKLDIKVQP